MLASVPAVVPSGFTPAGRMAFGMFAADKRASAAGIAQHPSDVIALVVLRRLRHRLTLRNLASCRPHSQTSCCILMGSRRWRNTLRNRSCRRPARAPLRRQFCERRIIASMHPYRNPVVGPNHPALELQTFRNERRKAGRGTLWCRPEYARGSVPRIQNHISGR